jgi:hypothetical protein
MPATCGQFRDPVRGPRAPQAFELCPHPCDGMTSDRSATDTTASSESSHASSPPSSLPHTAHGQLRRGRRQHRGDSGRTRGASGRAGGGIERARPTRAGCRHADRTAAASAGRHGGSISDAEEASHRFEPRSPGPYQGLPPAVAPPPQPSPQRSMVKNFAAIKLFAQIVGSWTPCTVTACELLRRVCFRLRLQAASVIWYRAVTGGTEQAD